MNFSYSELSTATMRKRPRTTMPAFDMACTSALSSISPSSDLCMADALSPNELTVTRTIDNALAQLDVSLGLGCVSTTTFPSVPAACFISIEDELDAVLAAANKQRKREVVCDDIPDDVSCVSGSGSLRHRTVAKVEDCSMAVDVLHELQALDSRTSTTATSPPLVKSISKRRRRRR